MLVFSVSGYAAQNCLILPKIKNRIQLEKEIGGLDTKLIKTLTEFPNLNPVQTELKQEEDRVSELKAELNAMNFRVLSEGQLSFLLQIPIPSKNPSAGPYRKQFFSIKAQKPFNDSLDYLNAIEKSSPFVSLNSFKMRQAAETPHSLPVMEIALDAVMRREISPTLDENLPALSKLPLSGSPFIFRKPVIAKQPVKIGNNPIRLSQIFFQGEGRFAVINGRFLREGGVLAGDTSVKKISPDQVVFLNKGNERSLAV